MKFYYIIILYSLFLSSCAMDMGDRKINEFYFKFSILSDKIEIREIFQPVDMVILDDYIVFQNEYMDKSDCFFVYSSKKHEFLYSFGTKGAGPEEFISPRLVDQSFGNTLSVVDNADLILRHYSINDKNVILESESNIRDLKFPIQDMSFVDDSLSLILYYTNEDVFLYSYNYVSNIVVDTLCFDLGFREIMGGNFDSAINDFNFCNNGKRFVVNFLFFNKLISGSLDSSGKFENKNYSHLKADFLPAKSLYDNVNYYHYPQMNDSYIYAQYYGFNYRNLAPPPFNLKGRNYNHVMEVYNLNMEPVALLDFDHESYRFYINKEGSRMYFWDPLSDFNCLFVFNIPEF